MATYTTYPYGSKRTDNNHYCVARYVIDAATTTSGSNCVVTITIREQIKGNEKPTGLGDGSITVFSKTMDIYSCFTRSTHSLANETVYPSAISGGYYDNEDNTCEVGRETFTYGDNSYKGVSFGLGLTHGQYHTTSGPSPSTSSWTVANTIVATFTVPMQHSASTVYIAGNWGSISPSYLIPEPWCVLNYGTNTEGYDDSSSYNWEIASDISIAIPAKTTYTIAYNANGGTRAPSSQTKWYGESITLSSTTPTRSAYSFYHWNTNSSNTGTTYNPGASYTANASATLYAIWNPIVTFNANGGAGAPASQTKTFGVALTLSSTRPTRTGYSFKRWNTSTNDSGSAYSPGGSYTANTATTLYAIWNPIVTYNANGGTGAPSSQIKTYGTALTLSSDTPTRSGFEFSEWNTASDGSGVSYSPQGTYSDESSITLYAIWTQTLYISSFTLERTNLSGSLDVTGRYMSAVVEWNTSGGVAGETLTVNSSDPQDSKTVQLSGTSGPTRINGLGAGEIVPDKTYTFLASLTGSSGGQISASATSTASSTGYAKPSIGSIDVARCDSSGTLDDEGTYAKLSFEWAISAVGSQTQPTSCSVSAYQEIGGSALFTQSISLVGSSGTFTGVVGGNVFDTDKQYYFVIRLQDAFYTIEKTEVLSMAYFTFDVLAGGHGVAFGKPSTTAELMDVAYEIHSDTEVSATDSNDVVHNLTEKVGRSDVVSKSGDTMTGALTVDGEVTATDANDVAHNLTEKVSKSGDTMTGQLGIVASGITRDTVPSANVWPLQRVAFLDSAGDIIGHVRAFSRTDGKEGLQFETLRYVNGQEIDNGLRLEIDASGNRHVAVHEQAPWREAIGAVNKAGDTMTGNLTVSKAAPNVYIKNTSMDISASSLSAAQESVLWFNDKNNRAAGTVWTSETTDGSVILSMRARRYNSSANVDNTLSIRVDSSGNKTYSVSSPANFRNAISAVPKRTQLYNNTTGSAGTITLSKTAANFNHIRVYYRAGDDQLKPANSVDIYSPDGKNFGLWTVYTDNAKGFTVRGSTKYLSGTTLGVRGQGGVGWLGDGSWAGASGATSNNIYIVRVEGWSE